MTALKDMKNTLRYKHMIARLSTLPPYKKEAQLKKEIVNGKQWRIDAAIEAINTNPVDWNYVNVTDVMKLAASFGRLQTVEKIADIMEWKPGARVAQTPVQAAFHVASLHGHYRTADAMAKRGAGPMYEAQGTPAAMYSAIEQADLKKIDYLLKRGANKDYLVTLASTSDKYMEVTKYLVEEKQSGVNFASQGFWTPFLNAVKYDRNDLAHYLLEHGATPQLDKSAGEALYTAVGNGNVTMINTMLDIGFKVDMQTLHHAMHSGQVDATKALLARGGLNINEGKQETLLLAIAAQKNAPQMVAIALEAGADASAALAALKKDPELYRYGNRAKMEKYLEDYLAPKAPKPPGFSL
ncbi:MAG: hypothetical protein PSY14_14685 [bacterium]|nr:hypothetical protein [bacterium]